MSSIHLLTRLKNIFQLCDTDSAAKVQCSVLKILIGQHLNIDCTQIGKFLFKDKICPLNHLFVFMFDVLCSL